MGTGSHLPTFTSIVTGARALPLPGAGLALRPVALSSPAGWELEREYAWAVGSRQPSSNTPERLHRMLRA